MRILLSLLVLITFSANALAVDVSQTIYERVSEIVGRQYIKGFWVFDAEGTSTTVTDRSLYSHNITLGGAASTLTPSVYENLPNLTMSNNPSAQWTAGDSDDFSFGNAGTDSAFSLVVLFSPQTSTSNCFIGKYESTGNQREYLFYTDASAKLNYIQAVINDGTKIVGRLCNTALSDANVFHCYISTVNGGSPQAENGIKIYRDGVRVDDASASAGVYSGMTGGTSGLKSSYGTVYGKGKYGIVAIISRELSAAEVAQVSTVLRTYIGDGIPPFDLITYEKDV